jgi:alpha-mannosidase
MALLNDSRYSFSVKDGEMRMTIVRSPVFSDHGGPRTSESVFTDQGLTKFEYELAPVSPEGDFAAVERMAAELNCPPVNIIENNHKGWLAPSGSFVSVDAENVSITAFKRAEDDNGWIVRAYETAGRGAEAKISLPLLDEELSLSFGKFEVKTVFIPDLRADAGDIREVMMTEFDF